eukprot:CAMPEP_0204412978 /NCGR_PEP_ID=MMETSP0470-20130426/16851_1 /ASSEMBLY_ACC=CAM_ASM_000385 /TAXON_ID=2969 /ORGANISM="Oxyrrhis marina" /LENGTH=46 /DNA_ID= /DNA_START= /DNA_END= /DNA_ORIENTATION=
MATCCASCSKNLCDSASMSPPRLSVALTELPTQRLHLGLQPEVEHP